MLNKDQKDSMLRKICEFLYGEQSNKPGLDIFKISMISKILRLNIKQMYNSEDLICNYNKENFLRMWMQNPIEAWQKHCSKENYKVIE